MTSSISVPASISDEPMRGDGSPQARLAVLDGWRAVSILLVLACHMLPLGPPRFEINHAAGVAGMSFFFTLSGFLIVTTIHRHPDVTTFLIRRLFRIVPLSALASIVFLLFLRKDASFYPPHLLYYLNYDHAHLTALTAHFWSLSVEVQFYTLAAFILAVSGLRGFMVLPFIGLAITALKIRDGAPHSIVTHLRADEIMVGASLGLLWLGRFGEFGRRLTAFFVRVPMMVWVALFAISNLKAAGMLQYLQPYLAGALVGRTLTATSVLNPWLCSRPLRYVAEISYALYVIHPASMYGWLGSGDKSVKYLKRPLCFLLTWAFAHLSTFKYERHFIAFGKRLCRRLEHRDGAYAPIAEPTA
jgi:peptidoglycan/LPS O-acetylase OafA/YrhL